MWKSLEPSRIVVPALLIAAFSGLSPGEDSDQDVARAAALEVLTARADGARGRWSLVAESPGGLERLLPDVHPLLCRMQARGGFPYEKLLISAGGTVLARSDEHELLARAAASSFRITSVEADRPHQSGVSGVHDLLQVFRNIGAARATDPGAAVTAILLLIDLLTVKGRFLSCTVTPVDGGGLSVLVEWSHGTPHWGFTETALWRATFDDVGALSEIGKQQREFERHMRR